MLGNARALYRVLHDIKLSNNQKEKLVSKRLRSVLISAYNYVPYYRKIMENIGYDPVHDYRGPEDLRVFPILTKSDLKTYELSSFVNENVKSANIYTDSTSGSTGIPIKVYRNWDERAYQIAKWLRVFFMNGYSVKEKVLSLTSPDRLYAGNSILQKFGILRRLAVNYLLPANQAMNIILNYKPQILYGNRSHIDAVALEFLKRDIKPKGLRLIVAGAETIHENSRNLCKQAFGLDIIEFYGSAEMGIMAFEIRDKKGLHLCDDLTFFEFLDDKGDPVLPGEPGRVIVTNLLDKTMPFIRYDHGDFAITDTIIDSKGAQKKIISKIFGRDDDQVILPDGTIRSFHDFYEIMDRFSEILQFRIIQKTKSYFQIKIAADHNYFRKIYSQIMDLLYISFPKSCKFDILRVDFLEPDLTGKLRMFVSELKNHNDKKDA